MKNLQAEGYSRGEAPPDLTGKLKREAIDHHYEAGKPERGLL